MSKIKIPKFSRSKINLFIECPCCFYLDVVKGVKRPPPFGYSLNSAVDTLLKREFDGYRGSKKMHPLLRPHGLVPSNHPSLDNWRDALHKGVEYHHAKHKCIYKGGIDDLWQNKKNGIFHVVDYKATAKNEVVKELPEWADGYRRQAEIYQWLLRKNGLKVSDTAYFLYCTGNVHAKEFNANLSFHMELIPYKGDDSWVDGVLQGLQKCIKLKSPPPPKQDCLYCKFRSYPI